MIARSSGHLRVSELIRATRAYLSQSWTRLPSADHLVGPGADSALTMTLVVRLTPIVTQKAHGVVLGDVFRVLLDKVL